MENKIPSAAGIQEDVTAAERCGRAPELNMESSCCNSTLGIYLKGLKAKAQDGICTHIFMTIPLTKQPPSWEVQPSPTPSCKRIMPAGLADRRGRKGHETLLSICLLLTACCRTLLSLHVTCGGKLQYKVWGVLVICPRA